ncbi:MAG: hypothetical protein ACM3X4_05490 [Ignavibacteriales bacterium]
MPEKENYDLSRTNLEHELGQAVNAADAPTPKSAGDEIRKALGDLQTTIREQQLGADKQLQSLLSEASVYIEASQRLDQMFRAIQRIGPMAESDDSIRSNQQQIVQALDQLSELAATHREKVAANIAQSLQESLSALALANQAMSENQAFAQISEMLKSWKSNLNQMGTPPQPVQ